MIKLLAKFVRKIIYVLLNVISFPPLKHLDNSSNSLDNIYKNKKIEPVNHKFVFNGNDLTIIVPVFNGEKFISRCADSLINQATKYNYNIIFINDGSVDKSLKILRNYEKKHKNISVYTQDNMGISEARNVGIRNAGGKYIAFIDIDDYVSPTYVEKLLDNAYKINADIVRCNYYVYDIKEEKVIRTGSNQNDCVIKGDLDKNILKFKGFPWGGIFKTNLWQDIEFPKDYWYEDMIIRMILFRKAKTFSYINDKLYYYCLHKNNISNKIQNTTNLKCLDQYYLVENLCHLSSKLNLKSDNALYYVIAYELSVILWLRTRSIPAILRKEYFLRACKIINQTKVKLNNKEDIILNRIFSNKDHKSWKLYAIYKMLGVKFGIE